MTQVQCGIAHGLVFSLVAGGILFLTRPGEAGDKDKVPEGFRRVARILDIKAAVDGKMVLEVIGQVPTGGWTDAKLVLRKPAREPADGIWDVDMFARPPKGIAAQVISKIKASQTLEKIAIAKVKGIRVHGVGKGIKEIKIGK